MQVFYFPEVDVRSTGCVIEVARPKVEVYLPSQCIYSPGVLQWNYASEDQGDRPGSISTLHGNVENGNTGFNSYSLGAFFPLGWGSSM